MQGVPGVKLHDLGTDLAAIVSFTLPRLEATAVKARLAEKGINISASKPSSTLLDATARDLPTVARASPHYYNSEDEVDQLISEVMRLANN